MKIIQIITQKVWLLFIAINLMVFIYLMAGLNLGLNLNWNQSQFKNNPDQVENLFNYLKNKNQLKVNYYTTREILHLQDIKKLLFKFKMIIFALLALLITQLIFLVKFWRRQIINLIKQILFICLGFELLLFIILRFYFEKIFYQFHLFTFSNDYWQLDPNFESLINVFPPAYFQNLIISTMIITTAIFIMLLALIYFLKDQTER
ncbi:MAG: hypothetical protein A2729_02665 [Candidatus Buchananbacteria bacterium RIFCSPHIGHO2_01_FULL_39_14]|uniref:TIGR01906 family membrane protein n=1 Tax=Candidatus Buchananbacteria bacterium RIFCSPHIGHO2_01_FULL_39_14 TaxID=1797532 RepID=A0A1G1XS81_9BACT|nr:MAG: hypothetical protein A2729_02665 [Candidatus Buchananbacteria bacterium RIFCSPHIGHO2_01_FULL_39_14]